MKILKKTMPILSAVLLFIGCSKDAGQGTVPDGPGIEDGKIELSFGLAIPKFPSALSLPAAGLTEEQENAVNNVWVLQFDASGNLVLNEYYDTFTVVSTTEKKVSVALFKYAASTVYFVANVGSELLKSLQPLTLSAFESRTLDFTDWASTVKTNGLPMVGVYSGSTMEAPTESIKLIRMVSRIEFTCTVDLTSKEIDLGGGKVLPADQLSLSRVQITNASSNVRYKAHTLTKSGDLMVCPVFPANATAGDLADNYRHYDEDASIAAQKTFTLVWYLPENLKGAVAGLTETTKGPANAPAGSTCIEISGDYTTSRYVMNESGVEELVTEIKDVTYCIYPGQNNTTDFNLIRNYSYKIGTTINGIDNTDTRVVVEKGIPAGEYTDGEWPEDASGE